MCNLSTKINEKKTIQSTRIQKLENSQVLKKKTGEDKNLLEKKKGKRKKYFKRMTFFLSCIYSIFIYSTFMYLFMFYLFIYLWCWKANPGPPTYQDDAFPLSYIPSLKCRNGRCQKKLITKDVYLPPVLWF